MTAGTTARRQDGMGGHVIRGVLIALSLAALPSCRLAALQCPDGAPPPCNRQAGTTGPTIAVLYFESRGRDTAAADLAESITEEVIEELQRIDQLDVRSRYVSRALGLDRANPIPAARAQGLSYVVTGTLELRGPRVLLRAELVRVASGRVIWSDALEGPRADLARLIVDLVRVLVVNVTGRASTSSAITSRPRRVNPESFELTIRAARLWRTDLPAELRQAKALLDQAVALDSSNVAAWSGLAQVTELLNLIEPGSPQRIRQMAERALALAPDDPQAVHMLAWAAIRSGDYSARTESLARRAVALAPRDAESRSALSVVLILRGKPSEGVAEAYAAVALDSLSRLSQVRLVSRLGNARRFREALAAREAATRLGFMERPTPGDTAAALLGEGRCEEAERAARAARSTGVLVQALGCLGRREEAFALFSDSARRTSPASWARLGEPDSAFAIIEAAYDRVRPGPLWLAITGPAFDPYRNHPRYLALLRRAGIEP